MQFFHAADPAEIKREKHRARLLRSSGWWKRKREAGICYFCGGRFPSKDLTMEHIVPLARGGKSVKSNIVPACKKCNSTKKYLLPSEWQQYLARLSDAPYDDIPGD